MSGNPFPGSPALVPWPNQGNFSVQGYVTTSQPAITITGPTTSTINTWTYSGTTGYVTFSLSGTAPGLLPGSEFTVTGGGGIAGITYVAVNPTGLSASAYQASTTIWGNPLSGPGGAPQANNPGASGSGGTFASVPIPGYQLLGAAANINVSPYNVGAGTPATLTTNNTPTSGVTFTVSSTSGLQITVSTVRRRRRSSSALPSPSTATPM